MLSKLMLPKWCDVLIGIYDSGDSERICQSLCRRVRVSHCHIKNSLEQLEKNGFIKIEQVEKGRKKAFYKDD